MSAVIVNASGGDDRTDINPALRYWEAFMMVQHVPQSDRDYLATNEWRGQPLPAKFGELVSGYNQEFRLMRAATHSTTPCDWGLDLSEGPELLLPHLAVAKNAAQMARLRVMWDLQNGRPGEARDDMLATLTLARNVSTDGTLISVLVQIAMENILLSTVAENYYQIPPETLKQLADGFEAAPPRGTMAKAAATGERSFYDWFLRKVQEAQKQHPGDEVAAMTSIRAMFQDVLGPSEGGTPTGTMEKILRSAGGTSDGLLRLIAEMPPMYERAAAIMSAPRPEYEAQIGQFMSEITNSPNALVGELFPALGKARPKEFAILTKLAMLQAAVEYKLHGDAGFNSVMDPEGNGPFALERFLFDGVDRGFEIKSTYAGRGYQEVMIFVEKDGPPFFVDGQHAGEAVAKPGAK